MNIGRSSRRPGTPQPEPAESVTRVVGSVAFGVVRLSEDAPEWDHENLTGRGGPIVGVPRLAMGFHWAGSSRRVVGTAATALFSNEQQAYRKRPLDRRGEVTDWVWARPELTCELITGTTGRPPQNPRQPFGFMSGPVEPRTAAALRSLTAMDADACDPLLAEEVALTTIEALVAPAFELAGSIPARRRSTDSAHRSAVNSAIEFLSVNLARRVTLTDVAREVHVSPLHFCRVFRERTGVTVHDYLTRLRLAAAGGMLAARRMSVTDIAQATGFTTANHLADTFRRRLGIAPTALRSIGARELQAMLRDGADKRDRRTKRAGSG